MKWLDWFALAMSVSALVYVLTTTRRIAKQRDEAWTWAKIWQDKWHDAMDEVDRLKKEAQDGAQHTQNTP